MTAFKKKLFYRKILFLRFLNNFTIVMYIFLIPSERRDFSKYKAYSHLTKFDMRFFNENLFFSILCQYKKKK